MNGNKTPNKIPEGYLIYPDYTRKKVGNELLLYTTIRYKRDNKWYFLTMEKEFPEYLEAQHLECLAVFHAEAKRVIEHSPGGNLDFNQED
jgi:hypothetical protein